MRFLGRDSLENQLSRTFSIDKFEIEGGIKGIEIDFAETLGFLGVKRVPSKLCCAPGQGLEYLIDFKMKTCPIFA